mmetsp:Transcript_4702/g.6560  ORF Transcript_4702/g.6560 Transcript_4702/m.6560 type:complete len:293 (+) Transcript_4702:72-950(+)
MATPHSEPLPRQHNEKKSKSKSKEPKTEPVERKAKTFNRLDHRFQLTDEHDDDHIFPEEYEMIKQLRDKFSALKDWSDKKIVCFLCARRHKMAEVVVLISRHLKKKEELGIDAEHPLTSKDAWKVMQNGSVIYWPDCVDKHERIVQYYKIGKDDPKATSLEDKYRMMFWECDYLCNNRKLKHLRNGLLVVVDMKDFKLSNLDFSNGKEINDAMTGVFPRRIRKFVVINGGIMLRAAVKAAKLILSKKMMKRVEILEDLSSIVAPQNILAEYGGNLKITIDDFYQNEILKTDN